MQCVIGIGLHVNTVRASCRSAYFRQGLVLKLYTGGFVSTEIIRLSHNTIHSSVYIFCSPGCQS